MIGIEPLNEEQTLLYYKTIDRQIRFATKNALNRTILALQARQRRHQERVFTIRQPTYWKQAIKIPRGGFATVSKLEARMITDPKGRPDPSPKWEMFHRQEYGGTRVPVAGRSYLAIPGKDVKRTERGIVRKAERPRALFDKKRAFIVDFSGGKAGLFVRLGKRQRGYTKVPSGSRMGLRQDPNVVFKYLLIEKADIDAVYEFYHNAEVGYHANFPRFMREEMVLAFKTARVRGFRG